MKRLIRIAAISLLTVLPLAGIAQPHPPTAAALSVAQTRANSLSPGMNLAWWFWFSGPAWDTLGTRYTRAELQGYYDAGIRGVRIPTDYYLMAASDGSSNLNATNIAKLDTAIQMCLDIGFNIIVDEHNAVADWGGADISDRIENDTSFRTTFINYWGKFAAHLSQFSADRVIFEPLNEPIFYDSQSLWTDTIMPAIVAKIRLNAPDHTLLLSGPRWSSPLELHNFDPATIDDANVIYNIHFYEPFDFTHQGADWIGSPEIQSMRHVPYPSTPERVAAILDEQTNQTAKDWLVDYGNQRWGPDKIAEVLDTGIDWAHQNHVAIMVTEFGALRTNSDPIDRAKWYQDVRLHLESEDVPWMIWSDLSGFGFDFEEGTYETRILIALGLLPGSIDKASVHLSQGTASPGDRLTASAAGYTPGSKLNLTLSGLAVGTATAKSDGSATVTFRIPNLSSGPRALKVIATDGARAAANLTIVPVVRTDPIAGKTGGTIRVRLYGFGKNQAVTVSIRQGTKQISLVRVTVDTTGTAGVTVRIPAQLGKGASTILARSSNSLVTASFTVTGFGASEDPTATATATISPTTTATATPSPTLSATATASPQTETATGTATETETAIATETPVATETMVEASPIT